MICPVRLISDGAFFLDIYLGALRHLGKVAACGTPP